MTRILLAALLLSSSLLAAAPAGAEATTIVIRPLPAECNKLKPVPEGPDPTFCAPKRATFAASCKAKGGTASVVDGVMTCVRQPGAQPARP